MKAKKVMALVLCAAMVSGLAATTVMAAPEDQFDGLTANEAYEFPMMVKSFQSTYWEAAMKGMDKAAEELGVTYTAQGPNSESDIADQVNMINTAIAANPVGLGLAACDTSSVQEALQTCVDKGIPVVTFDTGITDAPEGSVVCEVCTDNAHNRCDRSEILPQYGLSWFFGFPSPASGVCAHAPESERKGSNVARALDRCKRHLP